MKENSIQFWNQKITNLKELFNSGIYIHKNLIVIFDLLFKSGKYLDIGFGYGLIQKYISFFNKKIMLYGIDISDFAVKNIKRKINGNFKISSATKIPFYKVKFDIISALDILEHLNNYNFDRALNQIYIRLKKNGVVYLSFPINESVSDTKNNHHLQRIDVENLKDKLTKIGFDIIKVYQLSAYRDFYFLKFLINSIFRISKPNLIILICKK